MNDQSPAHAGAPLSTAIDTGPARPVATSHITAGGDNPDLETCNRLRNLLAGLEFETAITESNGLLRRYPRSLVTWMVKGYAAWGLGDWKTAEACAKAGSRLDPDDESTAILNAECIKVRQNGRAAIAALQKFYATRAPSERGALALAKMQYMEGAFAAAVETIHEALARKIGGAEMLELYGRALMDLHQPANAEKALSIATSLDPSRALAHTWLGYLKTWSQDPEAITHFKRAVAAAPDDDAARIMLLFAALGACDWDTFDAWRGDPFEMARLGTSGNTTGPWTALAFADDPAAGLARGRQMMATYAKNARIESAERAPLPAPHPEGRIRLGYFSSDFQTHATVMLLRGLIAAHDRDRFELHCFDYGINDATGHDLKSRFDVVHDIREDDNAAVVDRARAAGIDVAIDLKGHTKGTRSTIFLMGLAPVHVNSLGFPGTMGGPGHDYIVADDVVLPERLERFYDEKIIRLPTCYLPVDPSRRAALPPTRAELGLPEGGVVLACLNTPYKISRSSFGAWMEGLKANPKAVLWLMNANSLQVKNLRTEAGRKGVDPDRLIFAPGVSPEAHIARLAQADLFVDTFHVNAHTLAADALCAAGVPQIGRAHV